ncbi:50S ribosomal protein L13 [Candidatus Pacearchaeota archaeon]|nr:50S ribosomal protein L13 [Candidatus Pacearchaeota archaeon]
MIIIDGKKAVLGRLASYAAKEALKGEEIAIINCEQIIITGSKQNLQKKLYANKKRTGTAQQGPKPSVLSFKMVKRVIRGMLPTARHSGRGREALKRIKCYVGVPKEFEEKKKISMESKVEKFVYVKDISK